jgi:MFS family permease
MFNPTIGEVDPSAPPRKSFSSRRSSIHSDKSNISIPKAHVKTHLKSSRQGYSLNRRGIETVSGGKDDEYELNEIMVSESVNVESPFSQIISNTDENINSITEFENDEEEEVDDDDFYPKGWKPKLVVFGSFLACFTLFGIMNAIGAIESYVQSHQLANDSVSAVSWVFSIYMFVALFLGLLVGPLYDTFGATYLLLTGSILTFVGLFACGSATTIYQFILSFGLCTGFGTGFLMFPAVSVVSSWFNRTQRTFYIGVAQTGGSVGGIFFPILLRYLFDKYGFTWAMRIFSLFNLGVTLVACVLTRDRLKELHALTGEPKDERSFWMKLKSSLDINSFKDKQFMTLTAALFMNEFSLLIVLTYLASYAIANGATYSESYIMLTILNVSGTFGKFIPSYLSQKYGCFNMMILMSVSMSINCFVIWLPFGKYKAALYVFIVLFGFAYAATYSLTGATVGTITKKTKDFGKRYGSAYAIVSFGNLISLPISGAFIVNKTASDYDHMVAFAASTCALASILFIFSRYTVVGNKLWIAI